MSEDLSSGRDPLEEAAESFLDRLRAGERPPLSEYVRRYPHLAEEIREFFPALVAMEQLASAPAGAPTGPGHPPRLGDYLILREVGRGGMGVVYEAVQESLGRHVALKVLPPGHAASSTRVERFRREARAAAALHHTNVVPVFGVGEDQGVHYFAMQYIAGHSLAAVLREVEALREPGAGPAQAGRETAGLLDGSTELTLGPAYFRGVARVGAQVARALEYAHGQGLLHRDVKPGNVLLDGHGTAWLSDFGLAKLDSAEELTDSGDVVGTLRYLAPERFDGKADARSDVYALGLTLYEMATLRPAFAAPDRLGLIERIRHGVAVRPRQVEPAIPRDLETVILKACAPEPARRYQTAGEMADDLQAFLADRPIRARRESAWQRARRWVRRRPGTSLLLALLVVTFAAGLSGVLWQWREAVRGWATERQERQRKEEALAAEKVALQEKEQALAREKRAREDGEQALYRRNVALADLHWRNNRVGQARALLDECPADRRGWEWHYLRRRCEAHLLSVQRPGGWFVRFSHDGKRLALLGRSPSGCFAEVLDGSGHTERVSLLDGDYVGCVWQQGESLLAATTRTSAHKVFVYDGWTGRLAHTLDGAAVAHPLRADLFLPDGKHLAERTDDGPLRIWPLAGGMARALDLPTRHSSPLAFTPDGKQVLVRVSGKAPPLQLLDARTGALVRPLSGGASAAAYSPADDRLALGQWDGRVRLCAASTGATLFPLLGPDHGVPRLAFSGDGRRLGSGGDDGLVIVWDAHSGNELGRLRGHGAAVTDLAFDPAGLRLASCDRTGRALVFDLTTGQDADVREWPDRTANHVLSGDGRRFVACTVRRMRAGDVATWKETGPHVQLPDLAKLTLSHAGDHVAAGHASASILDVWDVRAGRRTCSLAPTAGRFNGCAFARSGRWFACAYYQHNAVELRQTDTGGLIRALPAREGMARYTLAISEDDRRVASLAYGGAALYVWDASTAAVTRQKLPEVATCLAWHPSGRSLAVGFSSGAVALYDAETPAEPTPLGRHETAVESLAFHGNGRRLASSCAGAVKVWDVERGHEVLELALPNRLDKARQLLFVGDELRATADRYPQRLVRWDGAPRAAR